MDSEVVLSSDSQIQTRRVRFGLKGSKPRVFKWEPVKNTIAPKPKNSVEFQVIAKKELELAMKFDNERASYDKFLDPDNVPMVEGSRQACGKRTTRLVGHCHTTKKQTKWITYINNTISLRRSGASSFAKVTDYAETLSCSTNRYQINPNSPIHLNGSSKLHDLGAKDSSARNSLKWDGMIGSEGYQAQWVPNFPKDYKPPTSSTPSPCSNQFRQVVIKEKKDDNTKGHQSLTFSSSNNSVNSSSQSYVTQNYSADEFHTPLIITPPPATKQSSSSSSSTSSSFDALIGQSSNTMKETSSLVSQQRYSQDKFHTDLLPMEPSSSTQIYSIDEFHEDPTQQSIVPHDSSLQSSMGNRKLHIDIVKDDQQQDIPEKNRYISQEELNSKRIVFSRIPEIPIVERILPPDDKYKNIKSDNVLVNFRDAAAQGDLDRVIRTLKMEDDENEFFMNSIDSEMLNEDGLDEDNVIHVLTQDDKIPGPTALHVACEHGHTHVVTKLLALGARVDAAADFDFTPLHVCALNGQYDCCELLLAHAAKAPPPNLVCSPPSSPFYGGGGGMLSNGFLQPMSPPKRLLPIPTSALSSVSSFDGGISKHGSGDGGSKEPSFCNINVSSLPAFGTLLGAVTKQRRTAVQCAVRSGDAKMVSLLLKAAGDCGACEALAGFVSSKPNTPNSKQTTPFSPLSSTTSPSSSNSNMIDYSKSETSFQDYESMDLEKLRKIKSNERIQVEADGRSKALFCFVNTCDDQGFGVLHDAAKRGHLEVVNVLLAAGARPEMKARGSNRTPAEIALECNHIEVCHLINRYAAMEGKTDWAAGRLRGLYDTKVKTTSETWHFLS